MLVYRLLSDAEVGMDELGARRAIRPTRHARR